MSEEEIKQARIEAQQSAHRFDAALDQLAGRIETGADLLRGMGTDLTEAASELGEDLKKRVLEPVSRSFGNLRENAVRELDKMEERPLAAWATVFLGGLFLGIIAAQAAGGKLGKIERKLH